MVVALAALVLALTGGAYAASQINGGNIKDGTIAPRKLNKVAQNRLYHSAGQHWGVIARNTIGSGVADLRAERFEYRASRWNRQPRDSGLRRCDQPVTRVRKGLVRQ
jgi:hypothetical protein